MANALFYPPANRTAQWFGDDFTGSLIDPDKVVWHSTETGSWPGYGGGASAPHLTYHALIHDWRQHYACNRSSRALRNAAGGVETNTDDALQVELIAYSDERLAAQRGHLPISELDSQALDDLGEFAEWAYRELGVPLKVDPGWVRRDYQAEHGMSAAAWRAFAGHTGHNRVPENTHWDPARLDIDEIVRRARGANTTEDDDMPTPAEYAAAVWDHSKALTRTAAAVWSSKIGKSGKSGGTLLLETSAKVDVLLQTVRDLPEVDTDKLAEQLTAAVAKANADAIVDELAGRLGDS